MVVTGPSTPFHCMFCGKTYDEHADEKEPRFTARVPCLLVKSGFRPKPSEVAAAETRRARQSNECQVPGCYVCEKKIPERRSEL
jgi:hypothetical protein